MLVGKMLTSGDCRWQVELKSFLGTLAICNRRAFREASRGHGEPGLEPKVLRSCCKTVATEETFQHFADS